ncbi:MAG: hypothetical protein KDE51_02320, partial [Anaerolineales bacterium]|nr:hypothetical protein [Anaerolineales bacterium]
TIIEPAGAMRNTQAPHILDVAGAVTVSHNLVPAPTLSPLKDDFADQLQGLCHTLNGLRPDALGFHSFGSMNDFATVMSPFIKEGTPFELSYAN